MRTRSPILTCALLSSAVSGLLAGCGDGLPGFLGGGVHSLPVDVGVLYDDGSLQAWADRELGQGMAAVYGALTPVSG